MNEAYPYPADHMDTLQQAALGYLRRHTGKYLQEQDLFDQAVSHLLTAFDSSLAVAENTVARAYAQMRNGPDSRYLDISTSSSHLAMLVDPSSGMHYAVPVSMIFDRLIGPAPKNHLRLASVRESALPN